MTHTLGPWRQGTTILTPVTAKWPKQEWDLNEAMERKMVFAEFRIEDQGRGRRLIANCMTAEDARLISAAPDMLTALLRVINDEASEIETVRSVKAAIEKATGMKL